MSWQVNYVLAYIAEKPGMSAQHVEGELIRIRAKNQPDVLRRVVS